MEFTKLNQFNASSYDSNACLLHFLLGIYDFTFFFSFFFFLSFRFSLVRTELIIKIEAMKIRCYRKISRISYKDHVTNEEVRAEIQQAIGPIEDLLTIVMRCKLQWYGHVSRSSGLAKTILQGTVNGGRRQGGQRKRWEDNIREWTGLEFGKSQRAVENGKMDRPGVRQVQEGIGEQNKMEKTGCKIICGAPTTLEIKCLMMMMIIPTGWLGRKTQTNKDDNNNKWRYISSH